MTDASVLESILSKAQEGPRVEQFQEQVELHDVELPAFQEWRFQIGPNDKLKLRLKEGTAEMFGTELSPNIEYSFQGSLNSCVGTLQGCKLQYWNCEPTQQVGEETTLGSYLNLSLALERLRNEARMSRGAKSGPRTLVIGPRCSGKTSLCRTLVGHAERLDHDPLLVNLNPRDAILTVPGCLTATAVNGMLNVENTVLGESITTGSSFYHPKQPLVKSYGMENYRDNLELFHYLIAHLGATISTRLQQSPDIAKSGLVIDTPAFHIGDLVTIQQIVNFLQVDVLVVIGNERLLGDLKQKLQYDPARLTLLSVPKSPGCVENTDKFEREMQQRAIKEYFYGTDVAQLSPYTLMVDLKEFVFLQPKPVETQGNGAFDLGSVDFGRFMDRVRVPQSSNLENAILAIADDSNAEISRYLMAGDDAALNRELISDVVARSVVGFCYVLGVDDEKGKAKLLVPSPVQRLPSRTLVLTEFRYHE